MMWVPLVLFLGTFFSGSKSQLVLTQPPSVAESLGSTVRISCALKSDSNYNDQRVRWYQQQNGGVPRFIYHYRHGNTQERGSGVPGRFTVSPEATNKLWYLVITGVQAEDEADYYCSTWDGTLSKYVFGGGTQVTVLSQAKAAPAVFVYPPSSEEVAAQNKATLVCLMNNFYPGAVQVTWKADNAEVTEGVETTRPSKQSDNRYLASSYLFLSSTDWASHNNYTCQVTHEGVDYEASVDRLECP